MSFQANIGQDEDFDEARLKAEKLGAKKVGEEYTSVIMNSSHGRGQQWMQTLFVSCIVSVWDILSCWDVKKPTIDV